MAIEGDWLYQQFSKITRESVIGKSEACQDEFALELFKKSDKKRFLDIGAGCPNCTSNTWLLEKNDWTGTCIDLQTFLGYKERKCNFIQADVTTCDLGNDKEYEYVSVDTDDNTNNSISNLINENIKPKFMTVEHDIYRVGEGRKNKQIKLMKEWGGTILFSNVQHKDDIGIIYEDWYIFEDNISNDIELQIENLKNINVFGSSFRTGQQCLWLLKLANAINKH
tara:strand:+ start:553 stop:1224 length:672 start_codon:yes stop_codon:yes gene_type:complete